MLKEKMIEYNKMFGESFPTYPLMFTRSEEEIVAIIDKCLESRKDVYELGYLKDGQRINY